MPPRSLPVPLRPPVENCTIMSGQCLRTPSRKRPKRSGSDVVVPSSLRTCTCTSAAPASYDACVDSTCSAIEIGTAGLSVCFGTEPVIATVMMQGVLMTGSLLARPATQLEIREQILRDDDFRLSAQRPVEENSLSVRRHVERKWDACRLKVAEVDHCLRGTRAERRIGRDIGRQQ